MVVPKKKSIRGGNNKEEALYQEWFVNGLINYTRHVLENNNPTSKEVKILETQQKYYIAIKEFVKNFKEKEKAVTDLIQDKLYFYRYMIDMQELAANINNKSRSKSANRKKVDKLETYIKDLNDRIVSKINFIKELTKSIKKCVVELDKLCDEIKDEQDREYIIKGDKMVYYAETQIAHNVVKYAKELQVATASAASAALTEFTKELIEIAVKAEKEAKLKYYPFEDVQKGVRNTALIFKDHSGRAAFTDIFRAYYKNKTNLS